MRYNIAHIHPIWAALRNKLEHNCSKDIYFMSKLFHKFPPEFLAITLICMHFEWNLTSYHFHRLLYPNPWILSTNSVKLMKALYVPETS